ncbi:MAG: tyrosine-protein phosphatase [Lachnospiraceae bacterium]|nr:tyrosine-protein phosphatase [Lachnospiraceae bacterium]
MLILVALGADKDTVMEDYMLTNVYNSQTLEYVKGRLAGSDMPQRKRDALMFMLGGVVERYMTGVIEALINGYWSVKEYMFEELGVGDPELKVLRRKFLE